ncbi:hypothetical protein NAMH_1505 [Nautilia profundicola AmH]|uniref:Uncharacterized protein n=1 Tax=Nautilia profundicola (strain ATCC BAA-1463 / DSM 18972 / AmH) TaxID=598659 RepID=B9L6A7_NAUPA|nr:hypothetical protein [Nautilia profundicola]ACM93007.1 hypothetical protein NAMH_1505 [Nautilia profundicola AmH]
MSNNIAQEIIKYRNTFNMKKYGLFADYDKFQLENNPAKLKTYLSVISEAVSSFISLNNDIYYINKTTGKLAKMNNKDISNFFEMKDKNVANIVDSSKFATFIKLTKQYKKIKYEVNLFAEKPAVILNEQTEEVIIVRNSLYIKEPEKLDIKEDEKEKIIKDYSKHFESKFEDFLNFIIYTRFFTDRKKSFLNLNAVSNWGKGFLMSIFTELLSVGLTITDEDLKDNKAGGLTEADFLNSIVLFIDEFKKFRNHLFKVTHEYYVEPKFGLKSRVPVFAKILLNADKSESFNYLIDEQISNRVLLMEISHNTKLTDRPLYKQNKYRYRLVIAEYIYNYITSKINYLINLGEEKANMEADKVLSDIYKKYSIKSNYNVEDLIKETIYNFLLKIKKEPEKITGKEVNIKNNIYNIDNAFFITKSVGTIMSILENELDKAEFSKVAYKKGSILQILNKKEKTKRIGGVVKRGIIIDELEINDYLNSLEVSESFEFESLNDFLFRLKHYIQINEADYTITGNVINFYENALINNLDAINESIKNEWNGEVEGFLKEFADNLQIVKPEDWNEKENEYIDREAERLLKEMEEAGMFIEEEGGSDEQ